MAWTTINVTGCTKYHSNVIPKLVIYTTVIVLAIMHAVHFDNSDSLQLLKAVSHNLLVCV